ncbi:MAG TPA: hypothetical protein VK106_03185 [Balneolaceae bacterium]|nr:hypothetical protein [Balneolaceae bacterium]
MNKNLKKKLLVLLLFVCCLLSIGLLLNTDPIPDKKIKNAKQLDSLIVESLYEFGIIDSLLTSYRVVIDSTFQRKVFRVTVPKKFPETKLHLYLKKLFSPYGFSLPARVLFPDKDLRIHFIFKNTIWRTLIINTEEPDFALTTVRSNYLQKNSKYL